MSVMSRVMYSSSRTVSKTVSLFISQLQRHTLRTGHSLQNRGRLASKYNYQPPSPRQRKDPSKHWGLDSDQPNRLPPLQMTLNPPTMVNGYGHSRYSEFGSSSDCPEVTSVTPGPSPFSPDTGKRMDCSPPDSDRASPSKRPRLSNTPTSQQQQSMILNHIQGTGGVK